MNYQPHHTEQLLEKTLDVMAQDYIEPDIVPGLRKLFDQRLALGHYDDIQSYDAFARIIGRDLRLMTDDKHLSLFLRKPSEPITHVMKHKAGKLTYNQGVEEVRYLHGNIGYLKFHRFSPEKEARHIIDAAFSFLKASEGMIIDLRSTMGGSPELARHMLSYFLAPETALWQVRGPADNEAPSIYHSEEVAHARYQEQYPVWILTSHNTASASELFAGVMQANGKAKVIGDVTAGAGFLVGVRSITEQLVFRISLLEPVISASGKGWEKVGIQPDIRVPAVDAFDYAFASGQNPQQTSGQTQID